MTASLPRPVCSPAGGFRRGNGFTLGVEEELHLVDDGGRLVALPDDDALQQTRRTAGIWGTNVSAELFTPQVEFATGVCTEAGQIVPQLAAVRSALAATGTGTLACGVHPAAAFGDSRVSGDGRYRLIGESLAGLLRTPTAAFQVHVGVPDEHLAVRAYRGIRHRLAVLQALAANSPFWHGRDSGLASARWAVISSYPRGGVPPVVRSWDEYAALVDLVTAAAEVPDYTHVWWDARLQPRLGTLEVRVMDSQPSLGAAAGLAALVQGLVRLAVEQPVAFDVPSPVLAENGFRVARHGLETRITDVDGRLRPVRELAAELVRAARAVLAPDGHEAALDGVERLLTDEPAYARQRRLHAERGMPALTADLVDRTAQGT